MDMSKCEHTKSINTSLLCTGCKTPFDITITPIMATDSKIFLASFDEKSTKIVMSCIKTQQKVDKTVGITILINKSKQTTKSLALVLKPHTESISSLLSKSPQEGSSKPLQVKEKIRNTD